ncbi:RuBisCO large subunit C-terminal-like domain-containing protein, partial [Mesorhizobium sp.]
GEQSTSTSRRVPLETEELFQQYRAHVESIEILGERNEPSLGSIEKPYPVYRQARIVVSWPTHNIGNSLPMLWTTILGNQTGMRRLSGIRLERIDLPSSFVSETLRPAFGIEGTRRLTGTAGRPLIGSVIKPNIGLVPEQTAEVVRGLAESGVDFVKDDELMSNPPYCPIEQRVTRVMDVINRHADKTGKKVMYAFNISGDADELRRRHDAVAEAGGTCVMVNLNSVGLAGVIALRKHSVLPIHGHRAGWATMTRAAMQGLDFSPFQMVHRLAGVDHIHVSGLGRKFWESEESIVGSAKACLSPMTEELEKDDRAMPVVSGGSTIHQAKPTYDKIGSKDLIYVCGSGIMSHPMGPAAGVRSIVDAWEGVISNIDLRSYASSRPALSAALEHWPEPNVSESA